MPPKRKSATATQPRKNRRTGTVRKQPPPSLVEQASKLQLESSSTTDPLAKLDDLCLDLVFCQLEIKDLCAASAVSRLWRIRSTCWICNSGRRARELSLMLPEGIDPHQDPLKYAAVWRHNGMCPPGELAVEVRETELYCIALMHVLRESARPPKVIKLNNVVSSIWDISGPYIAWIECEKLKYQWSQSYANGI